MLVKEIAQRLLAAEQKVEISSMDKREPGAWFFESPAEIRPELMEFMVFGIRSNEAVRWSAPDWRFEHIHYITLYVGKVEEDTCT